MSILTEASLIVTPNAYKAGTLLSVVPSSGAGDMVVARNSGATRVNSEGLIENVLANVPRLDYSQGSCPNILLEPQRTNRLLNSEILITQSLSTTGLACAVSFYGTGIITFSGTFTGTLIGMGANNRVSTVFTPTTGTLTLTVSGSVTKAQLEQGSYPTSYIPTTSASVTRVADVVGKTGISDLIGQTEGTLFIDFVLKNPLTATNRIISITENTWTEGSIRLDIEANSFGVDFVNAGTSVASILYATTVQPNTRYKIAIAYKINDCQMYINGVNAGSDTTTGVMPTCSDLYLNALGFPFNSPYEASNINTAALWKTRLTNDQLAQLTTL